MLRYSPFTSALIAGVLLISAHSGLRAREHQVSNDQEKQESNASVQTGFRYMFSLWNPGFFKNDVEQMRSWDSQGAFISNTGNRYYAVHLYNPTLSIRLSDRWALSGAFYYSRISFAHHYMDWTSISRIISSARVKGTRLEGDLIFSRIMNKWLKLYFGPKYQGFLLDVESDNVAVFHNTNILPFTDRQTMGVHTAGLGFGLALTVPLYRGLYLLGRLSGIALAGSSFGGEEKLQSIFVRAGMNSGIDLAYVFGSTGLTVTMGGIVQYMNLVYDTKEKTQEDPDFYYGPTVAVVYSF